MKQVIRISDLLAGRDGPGGRWLIKWNPSKAGYFEGGVRPRFPLGMSGALEIYGGSKRSVTIVNNWLLTSSTVVAPPTLSPLLHLQSAYSSAQAKGRVLRRTFNRLSQGAVHPENWYFSEKANRDSYYGCANTTKIPSAPARRGGYRGLVGGALRPCWSW